MTRTHFYRMKQEIKLLLPVSLWLAVTVFANTNPTVLIVRPLSSYPVAASNQPADFFFIAKHTGGTNYGLQQISSTNLYFRDNLFNGDTAPFNGWLYNTNGGGSMKLTAGGVNLYPSPLPPQFVVTIAPFIFTRFDNTPPTVYFGLAEMVWSADVGSYVAGTGYGLVTGGLAGNFAVTHTGTNWIVSYHDSGRGGFTQGGIQLADIAGQDHPSGSHHFAFQIPPESGSYATVTGYVWFSEVTNPPPAGFNGNRFFQRTVNNTHACYLHLDNHGNQAWSNIP